MVKRFVVRGLGIVDPRLAESVLTDAVSYLRRGCVEHHRRRIGISLAIFSSSVFSHLGSPKVSVLNGWNEGRGKARHVHALQRDPSFRPGRWSWRADAHRPSHKNGTKICSSECTIER